MLTYAEPQVKDHAAAPATAPPAARRRAVPTRKVWAWVRLLGGVAILAGLVWRVGADGFLDGLRMVEPGTLLIAFGLGVATTVLSAWRWCLVARGLGISLRLPGAVADYYRALFLNAALPGGILGDVHRAVRHGRDLGDLGLGVRAVALERLALQVVLFVTGVTVLVAFPTPALSPARLVTGSPVLAVVAVAALLVAVVLLGSRLLRATSRWARACRTTVSAVRHGLLGRRVWPGVVISSIAVLAGFIATFLVAARAVGVSAPTLALLPLLVLTLMSMSIPLNVGGWGPREGVCAWAFAAAGLGAAQGLAVAVVYGVSVFVATLPGAAVLAVRWWAGRGGAAQAAPVPAAEPGSNRSESA